MGVLAREVGENMSEIDRTLASVLAGRYTANAARVRELAMSVTDTRFWQKPFPFGNSFGHLVLHLSGNLKTTTLARRSRRRATSATGHANSTTRILRPKRKR